jgi:hypothetical protein
VAGAVRQAADEIAFLERADQPVHAGLGFEVQRLLHFFEGGRNARFAQPLIYEAEQFMLFARQHRGHPEEERTQNV